MQKTPGYPLDSVDHALRLLLLLRTRGELRVTEAAEILGVAKSTAHRLLSMLTYRDFATQDARRVYHPGSELTALRPASRSMNLCQDVEPYLRSVTRQSGETSHLMALEGNSSRFLAAVEGDRAAAVGCRIGLLLPAHTTSGGKALLAEIPTIALRALYPRGLPITHTAAITDFVTLRHELAMVRRRGYATNVDESGRGVSAVARSIHDCNGRAVGAIAIATPSTRGGRQRLSELAGLLADAVEEIEQTVREPVSADLGVGPAAAAGM